MPASTVGTSVVQFPDQEVAEIFIIKAADANTGIVYVLDNSDVTANSFDATDGIPLSAGQSITITPYMCGRNSSTIYARASAASKKVFYWVR